MAEEAEIDLGYSYFNDRHVTLLCQRLEEVESIYAKKIDLSDNEKITNGCVPSIMKMLEKRREIEEIDLEHTAISDKNKKKIKDKLKENVNK